MELIREYFATARERYQIKLRRESGQPFPWSEDSIFREWRFCNVHREDDRTTVWFRENIRSRIPCDRHEQIVFATLAFRWFNRIETGERIKDLLVVRWDERVARKRLTGVSPVVTGAYIIHTYDGMSKLEGVLRCIREAHKRLPAIVERFDGTLRNAWSELRALPYMGRFTAYEVVSDLRWTSLLRTAPDVDTWANAGPGCARGLSRVVTGELGHFAYGSDSSQETMLEVMQDILALSRQAIYWPPEWKRWEMREVEHWACEFDKIERARAGERLKRRYP